MDRRQSQLPVPGAIEVGEPGGYMATAKNGDAETSSRNYASSLVRLLLLHSGNHKTEYNSSGIPIICPNFSAMGLDNLPTDGEPEPSAAGAGFGLAALHKFIEHHI